MAWRDRTNLYISYRQSYAHHPSNKNPYAISSGNGYSTSSFGHVSDERRGLMSGTGFDDDSGDAVIEMDILPPRWADISDEVSALLASISQKSQKLEKLHQKHVLPGFDDEDVKRAEESEIERITQEITRGFHACQKAIKRLETMAKEAGDVSRGEATMARNIQISLAGKVQEASTSFRKKQSAYLKRLQALSGFADPAPKPTAASYQPYSDPSLIDNESDKAFSQSTLQTQSLKPLTSNDHAIAQREREINDIAQGIIELADIFKELQSMIIDQGTMLDRIDYNVERMATDVKAADKELIVASGYQRRSLKRKIIFLLLLIIVGVIILLATKPRRQSGAGERPPIVGAPPVPIVDVPNEGVVSDPVAAGDIPP